MNQGHPLENTSSGDVENPLKKDEPSNQSPKLALISEIERYSKKINYDIGFYYWKRYVYSAFWNNISTPINLVIMILTAITTGQTAIANFLSKDSNTVVGVLALIISVFNTFFRPAQQLNENVTLVGKWSKLGTDFEKLYYENDTEEKLKSMKILFNEINDLKRDNKSNCIVDIIFLTFKSCCLKKNILWIPEPL